MAGKKTSGPDDKEPMNCAFCGKKLGNLEYMRSPMTGAPLCVNCLHGIANAMSDDDDDDDDKPKVPEKPFKVPTPAKIKTFLDEYIIGHDAIKKTLAVAVYNHYKRLEQTNAHPDFKDVEIEKSNIMLIGPTGCGKTLFAKTLAKMLNVPFAIADATTVTEAGYVGEDVENILLYLLQAADMNKERAARGIVYIDEIDKISRRTENSSITRDVSGEGVQQALLKIIEGTISRIPEKGGRKHPQQDYISLDTSNILFICGGAFVGLDEMIKNRLGKASIGFIDDKKAERTEQNQLLERVQPEDLVKYGLIPEFVGRIPVMARMEDLTEGELVRILTEPKNCIVNQYRKLLSMSKVKLSFEPEALVEIARQAILRKTGARGLRAIMEQLMTEIMYEAPSTPRIKTITITHGMILKQLADPGAILSLVGIKPGK